MQQASPTRADIGFLARAGYHYKHFLTNDTREFVTIYEVWLDIGLQRSVQANGDSDEAFVRSASLTCSDAH